MHGPPKGMSSPWEFLQRVLKAQSNSAVWGRCETHNMPPLQEDAKLPGALTGGPMELSTDLHVLLVCVCTHVCTRVPCGLRDITAGGITMGSLSPVSLSYLENRVFNPCTSDIGDWIILRRRCWPVHGRMFISILASTH